MAAKSSSTSDHDGRPTSYMYGFFLDTKFTKDQTTIITEIRQDTSNMYHVNFHERHQFFPNNFDEILSIASEFHLVDDTNSSIIWRDSYAKD